MKQSIIDKYNVGVPRYTSYPPANYFSDDFSESDYRQALADSDGLAPQTLSFYFHIPFCRRLCHYCGCNSYSCPDTATVDRYVEALHREIDLIAPLISPSRRISQIHFGGGTPTFLPPATLKDLISHLFEKFSVIQSAEIAAECHPGWMTPDDWEAMARVGFTRLSLGIQDFDPKVLTAVGRQPSLMPVSDIFALLRSFGISINMDLLYGLPLQTPDSFTRAAIEATSLLPDRVVTFSYAHVPWAFPRQKVLESLGLPGGKDKELMFESARRVFLEAGYVPVGLDHFVRKDDELSTALSEGMLHRNFQGYCTRRTTGQVYAFGVTGISQLANAYAQNTKSIPGYISLVNEGHLPVAKGYRLTEAQQVTREVIEMLMCNYFVDWNLLSSRLGYSPLAIRQFTAYNADTLTDMAADGLIQLSPDRIAMTPAGRLFVRNVAASLDPLMINSHKSFSTPL